MVNESLARYSDILGFRIEFSIDLSTTRKEFVTVIERDGNIIEYDELSGGERQVCNIAMAFAMNEALTSSKGINIAFLDEVFESLSQDNIELIISLINSIFDGKTLFLITHHDSLPLSKSRVLQVDKIDGRSNYKVL
jgi:DNA repair exonuclease SbcCD ATPase subunit